MKGHLAIVVVKVTAVIIRHRDAHAIMSDMSPS